MGIVVDNNKNMVAIDMRNSIDERDNMDMDTGNIDTGIVVDNLGGDRMVF